MSMPEDWVLQQYQEAAVSVVYAMNGQPFLPVELPGGRIVAFWMTQAVEMHLLRLRLDALRQAGLV